MLTRDRAGHTLYPRDGRGTGHHRRRRNKAAPTPESAALPNQTMSFNLNTGKANLTQRQNGSRHRER